MPVTMICPNLKCGRTVVAPDKARGKVVRCVHCQHLFMVPAPKAQRSDDQGQSGNQPAQERGKG